MGAAVETDHWQAVRAHRCEKELPTSRTDPGTEQVTLRGREPPGPARIQTEAGRPLAAGKGAAETIGSPI